MSRLKDPGPDQERPESQIEGQSEGPAQEQDVQSKEQSDAPLVKGPREYAQQLKKLDEILKNLYHGEKIDYPSEPRMPTPDEYMQRLKILYDKKQADPSSSSQQSVVESQDTIEINKQTARGYRRNLKRIHPAAFKNETSGAVGQKRSESTATSQTKAITIETVTSAATAAAADNQNAATSQTANTSKIEQEPVVDWTQEEIDLAMEALQKAFPDQIFSLQGRKIISTRRSTNTIISAASQNTQTTENVPIVIDTIDLTQNDDEPEIKPRRKLFQYGRSLPTLAELEEWLKKEKEFERNKTYNYDVLPEVSRKPVSNTKRADDILQLSFDDNVMTEIIQKPVLETKQTDVLQLPTRDKHQQNKKKKTSKNNMMTETREKPDLKTERPDDDLHIPTWDEIQQIRKKKTSNNNTPESSVIPETGEKPEPRTKYPDDDLHIPSWDEIQQIKKKLSSKKNTHDHNAMPKGSGKPASKTKPDNFRVPSWNELHKIFKEISSDNNSPDHNVIQEKGEKTSPKFEQSDGNFILPTLDELQKLIKKVSSDHNVVEKSVPTNVFHYSFKSSSWEELQKMLKITYSDDDMPDEILEIKNPDTDILLPTINEPDQIIGKEAASDNETPDHNEEPEMVEKPVPDAESDDEFRLPTLFELQQMIDDAESDNDFPCVESEIVQPDEGFIFPTWSELDQLIKELSSHNVVSENNEKPVMKTVRFFDGFQQPSWDELKDMLKKASPDDDDDDNNEDDTPDHDDMPGMVDIAVADTEPFGDDFEFPALDDFQNMSEEDNDISDQNEVPEIVENPVLETAQSNSDFNIPTLKELDNMSKDVPSDSDTPDHNIVPETEPSDSGANDSKMVPEMLDLSMSIENNQTLDIGAEVEIPYDDNSAQYKPFKIWESQAKLSDSKTGNLEEYTNEVNATTTENKFVGSTQPKINLPVPEAKMYIYDPFSQLNTDIPNCSKVAANNKEKTQDKKSAESSFNYNNANNITKQSSYKYIPFRVIDENYLNAVGSSTDDHVKRSTDSGTEECKNDDENKTFNSVTCGQPHTFIPTPDPSNDNVITLYKSPRHCNDNYKELLRKQKKERITAATGTSCVKFEPVESLSLPCSSAPATGSNTSREIPVHIGERKPISGTNDEIIPDSNSEDRRNNLPKGIITYENYRSNSRYEVPQEYDYQHLPTRATNFNCQQNTSQNSLILIDCHGNESNDGAKENYAHLSQNYPQKAPKPSNFGHHILSYGNNLYTQEVPIPPNYDQRSLNSVNNPYAQEAPIPSSYDHQILSCGNTVYAQEPRNYAHQIPNSGHNLYPQEGPKQSNYGHQILSPNLYAQNAPKPSNYGHQIPNSENNLYVQEPLQPSNYGHQIPNSDNNLYVQEPLQPANYSHQVINFANNPYSQETPKPLNYGDPNFNCDHSLYVQQQLKPSNYGHQIPNSDNNSYALGIPKPSNYGNYPYAQEVPKPSNYSQQIPNCDNNLYNNRNFQPYGNTFGNYTKYSTQDNVSAELDNTNGAYGDGNRQEQPKDLNLEAYYQQLANLLHAYYNKKRVLDEASTSNTNSSQDNTRQKPHRVPLLPQPYYQIDYANMLEKNRTPKISNEQNFSTNSSDNISGTTRRQQLPEGPPATSTSTGTIPRTTQYSYYNPERFRRYLQERVEEVKTTELSGAAGVNFPSPKSRIAGAPHVSPLGTQPHALITQTPQEIPRLESPGDIPVRAGLGRVFVGGGGRDAVERGSTERGRPIRGQRGNPNSSNIRVNRKATHLQYC